MRLVGALALLALGLAAAVYLHSYREPRTLDLSGLTSYGSSFVPPPRVTVSRRPAWDDPAAVLALALGAGAAVALLRALK